VAGLLSWVHRTVRFLLIIIIIVIIIPSSHSINARTVRFLVCQCLLRQVLL
jgi:hypothetical protein